MYHHHSGKLRSLLREYTRPSTPRGLAIFAADYGIFVLAIIGTLYFQNYFLKTVCAIVAGMKMSTLFVIAHDAAHDNYTSSRRLNRILGRLAFMPCLHNYSLWLVAHNQKHHLHTNVRQLNSWSPMSKCDYDNLPVWRKTLERFYRSPAGICFYYMIERWWKEKFYPFKSISGLKGRACYADFIFLLLYLGIFTSAVIATAAAINPGQGIAVILAFAFILPFLVFNFMVGLTVYQQHTHESIPWYKDTRERNNCVHQHEVVMHVRYPFWFNLISLNAMEHTAHHVDPRIPLYNLAAAQHVISDYLAEDMVTVEFSASDFLQTMKSCKLYDYENHRWLDFKGNITAVVRECPVTGALRQAA